jgi:predicted AlkP superfamily phosphohydrolase/phosphomutase
MPLSHKKTARVVACGLARGLSRAIPAIGISFPLALLLGAPPPAAAYIGPGAGFALLSSFLVLFTTIITVIVSLLIWPVRLAWRAIVGPHRPKPSIRRLIVIGLDGQEPKITERLMKAGALPAFAKLAREGCFHRLKTTYPSVSPVAWSSFSTGTNPARHNIFDFLDRDRRTYLPLLSSTQIGKVRRALRIGRFTLPLERPELRLLRKSKPFWTILGEHRIWSTILRVPITFPPDRFYGAELSAMCVPDLLGTQGTFTFYTTRPPAGVERDRFKEGGVRVPLAFENGRARAKLTGPPNAFLSDAPPLELSMTIDADRVANRARIAVDGATVELEPGRFSDWVSLSFRAIPGIKVSGICRMMVTELGDHVSLYVSPINIDPERPAMPVSHPSYYATYLAKKIGPFATLGLAEDTWALNEGVIDEAAFLQQTYDIDLERRRMFFAALDRLREGALACVFDATDRIQHMFWRHIETGHPAARGANPAHRSAIDDLYRHNDAFLADVMLRLDPKQDVLMVISDHGFTSFRRAVNVNAWLLAQGYLALEPGADGCAEWLRGVDWSRTKAYALGLTGLFLNLKGREGQGIVSPGAEAAALKAEIIRTLGGLEDPLSKTPGITEVFDTSRLYAGPYVSNAPDLLVGYNHGYRVSWNCASGVVAGPIFEDNVKAWSGDHCVDPRLVPGVFFCNRHIDETEPALVDVAPTVLRLFGVEPPPHMEGRPLFRSKTEKTTAAAPAPVRQKRRGKRATTST